MPEIIGIFGSKGDALTAVDELYRLGYGDTEIGFIERSIDRAADEAAALEPVASSTSRVASAIAQAGIGDELGFLYRESVDSGSAVLTVSAIDGDETDVTKVMYASGALKVNSYRDEIGWGE